MEPLLLDIAHAVRKHCCDDKNDIVKVEIDNRKYFLLKFGEKVNIQQVFINSPMRDKGWWLLADNTVYSYDK